jgi:AraC-like DNA-binding protein
MKIVIKNMVCDRCILVIQNILDEQSLRATSVQLGEVDFGKNPPSADQLNVFKQKIEALGFELISDKKSQLMVNIKRHIVDLVTLIQQPESEEKIKLSHHLSNKLHHDYTYLSNLFSAVEGVTIEQYFIHQKIEKVKELLIYDEISLTEIAYQMGYSSVAHLSRQFKKVTGSTPTQFKQFRDASSRRSIDKV